MKILKSYIIVFLIMIMFVPNSIEAGGSSQMLCDIDDYITTTEEVYYELFTIEGMSSTTFYIVSVNQNEDYLQLFLTFSGKDENNQSYSWRKKWHWFRVAQYGFTKGLTIQLDDNTGNYETIYNNQNAERNDLQEVSETIEILETEESYFVQFSNQLDAIEFPKEYNQDLPEVKFASRWTETWQSWNDGSTPLTDDYSYIIEYESFSETLIQDNTWLHSLFYDNPPPNWDNTDEAWRYWTTLRVYDNTGKAVKGRIFPIPSDQYAKEYLRAWFPPRSFELMTTACGWLLTNKSFVNIDYAGNSSLDGYANSEQYWIFQPESENYNVAFFKFDLDDMRLPKTNDLDDWDEPYHNEYYGWKYKVIINDDDDQFNQYRTSPKETFDNTWISNNDSEAILIDSDDKEKSTAAYSVISDKIEELLETLEGKQPFGWLALIFDELENFTDAMDNEELSITFETEEILGDDVTIELINGDTADLLSTIRIFSGWVFYAMLGMFFYGEYRKLVGGGQE